MVAAETAEFRAPDPRIGVRGPPSHVLAAIDVNFGSIHV